MKTKLLGLFIVLACFTVGISAPRAQISVSITQGAISSTTLAAAIAAPAGNTINVSSITNMVVGQFLLVDQEAMRINTLTVGSTFVGVSRGAYGTEAVSHPNSSVVYFGPGYQFQDVDPLLGSCGSSTTTYLPQSTPWINTKTGTVWQCTAGVWLNVVDAYVFVPPSACAYSTSGGTLATPTFGAAGNTALGLINASSAITPVYQVATTNSGTATNTLTCVIPVPSRTNLTRGSYLMDDTFFYGVQQTGLGTQVAVLASGTMNAQAVFTSVTLPAAGASESASTVTPVRLDTGTLTITPVVASSNVATTTAGAFYSVKFTPATPLALTTDLTAYYVNATFLCTATSATTINTPGHIVHYRSLSGR